MVFDKFLARKKEEPEPFKALPFNIRYALEHRGALLNTAEVKELAESGFENEAFYLLFKSLRESPEIHKALFEKYLVLLTSNENHTAEISKNALKIFITESLKSIGDISVQADKLSQFSHQGFNLWQEKMKSFAVELSKDDRNVYLIAHSMFVGLSLFLQECMKTKKSINIIVPEWLGTENIGYVVTFGDDTINAKWLHRSFDGTKGSVVLDDTINTGASLELFKNFLIKYGSQEPEIQVIDKVPDNENLL